MNNTPAFDRAAIKARHRKAVKLLRNAEWITHIPPQPDSDPQLVIGPALRDVAACINEIDRLQAIIDAHTAACNAVSAVCREWEGKS